ncbi:MAG TPA: acyltransferase [Puia sp.]|nr:acyltransferase [Puia sp.]
MVAEKKEDRIRHLDGFRGMAIFLVGMGHFFNEYALFRGGWVGLNLFFLLSGYLITGRLFYHAQGEGKHYFRDFYARRVLRIFPLYYGCLFIFFVWLPLVYGKYAQHFSDLYGDQLWYWCYLENWQLAFHGIKGNLTLFHFWSLSVEEQFYLCWPLIFLYAGERGRRIAAMAGIVVAMLSRCLASTPWMAYFSTLTACEPLLLGALICLLEKEGRLHTIKSYAVWVAGLSFLFLIGLLLHNPDAGISNRPLLYYGYSAIDAVLAYLLYSSLLSSRVGAWLRKVFSSGWLVWLGKYSYGLYVFHWLILQIFVQKGQTMLVQRGADGQVAYLLPRIGGIGLVLLIGYASYHLYEKQFLRWKKYFS